MTTVAVTSDRGLCGGLNSSITKYTRQLLSMYKGEGGDAHQAVVTIGDKGRSQIQRFMPDKLELAVADTYKNKVTYGQVRCSGCTGGVGASGVECGGRGRG